MPDVQKITTCLWFDGNAEEAAAFYCSLFDDSRIVEVQRYTEAGPGRPGDVVYLVFELAGQQFSAINGGPQFRFTEAISLMVACEDQAEVDRLWEALTADGGQESQCGWLKDRYGLSWQIVPRRLNELTGSDDPAVAARVTEAMLKMRKIDLSVIEEAARG
ncbi:VOC family protein [Streptomyces sp. 7-21]|uniref:VOC family protein n=1 Tax=Streptomyces sp. 7-21 TaxID=2802283 RepID=UPI00191F6D50|nr:VOC family protein [Streptomyces sp. 7-21]MBL1068234.1 VOC family protein [Streptomyces sp. 7-21]